jgi:hypothetical protein
MPKSPLENQLIHQISATSKDDFQALVTEILLLLHGSEGFTNLRRTKDAGSDGIVQSTRTSIACWGPEKPMGSNLQKAFEKKMQSDYSSYKNNWESIFPNWAVYVNHHPTPNEVKYIESMKPGTPIIGLDGLISIIMNDLCSARRRKVCKLLLIPEEFVSRDLLESFFNDILSAANSVGIIKYRGLLAIDEKIELNFSSAEVDGVRSEYDYLQDKYFAVIKQSFSLMGVSDLKRVKGRIVSDFVRSPGGTLSEKMSNQTEMYINRYTRGFDDEYQEIVRAVQYYEFEQCLYGIKTASEENKDGTP